MTEKLIKIAENSQKLHDRCNLRHYTAVLAGDGSTSISFKLPFQPDLLEVVCTDPRVILQNYSIVIFVADLNGLGLMSGFFELAYEGGVRGTAMTTTSVLSRFSIADDGTVTLSGMKEGNTDCVFGEDFPYQIVATKLTDKGLRQRYEEFVESLTGSGTCQVCKQKVYSVFTTQEWEVLKATRPNWTFKEV